jgi:DNA topoisomerase II
MAVVNFIRRPHTTAIFFFMSTTSSINRMNGMRGKTPRMNNTAKKRMKKRKISGGKQQSIKSMMIKRADPERSHPPQKRQKTSSSTFSRVEKKSHGDHVLDRPENYIGTVDKTKRSEFLATIGEDGKLVFSNKEIEVIPALLQIVDEILVNAIDHQRNSMKTKYPVKNVTMDFDKTTGKITIQNDGNGIPIEKKGDEYIGELCFGHLLTSSNYNDKEERLVGGRNGFGAGLTNIWSKEFLLETVWIHPENGNAQQYKQKWSNNMKNKGKPKIKDDKRKNGYTKVSFVPDYERFGIQTSFFPTFESLLLRRLCDMAATTMLNVKYNKKKINLKQGRGMSSLAGYGCLIGNTTNVTHTVLGERWECVVLTKPDVEEWPPIPSFVNGVRCDEKGPFCEVAEEKFIAALREKVKKQTKVELKKSEIMKHVGVVVNALIKNPRFSSQTKDKCTTKRSDLGSSPVWKPKDLKKAVNAVYPVIEEVAYAKINKKARRMVGAVKGSRLVIPKYEGAKKAGTKHESIKCSLVLTEGDSAKALATQGFSVTGRKYFGVFPLKGKLLNTRKEKNPNKIIKNAEIQNLMQIVGLQPGVKADRNKLRYGRIIIFTDQDVDGSHIKGLVLSFLHLQWPETLTWKDFVTVFHTPIIVAKWGRGQKKMFFTKPEFDQWKENEGRTLRFTSKYYKGLATSNKTEAKEYFSNLERHLIAFNHETNPEEVSSAINIAFSDDNQYKTQRKELVRQKSEMLVDRVTTIPDFVTRELKLFWDDANHRSIPHAIDGLKESQRKVLFSLRKKNCRSENAELRVAQLAAYTSEHTSYEHGEASLNDAITKMGQTYMGSNNVNLLYPSGMFGTRLGEKDYGSPRYIHTYLAKLSDYIFPPANDCALNFLQDENNKSIEPEFYVPVIPFALVNGIKGMGVGVSVDICPYNPMDILNKTRECIEKHGMEPFDLVPWFRGFKGRIFLKKEKSYEVNGVLEKLSNTKLRITELIPGVCLEKYKTFLENLEMVRNVYSNGDDVNIDLEVIGQFENETQPTLMKKLHLISSLSTNNMHALYKQSDSLFGKFTVHDIVVTHYQQALKTYETRKAHEVACLERDIQEKMEKAYFIKGWVDGIIQPGRGSKFKVIEWMATGNYTSGDEFKSLRRLPNEQLFADKIAELNQAMAVVNQSLRALQQTRPVDIWKQDLDAFEREYKKQYS